jgi:hypothetical protein
MRGNIIVSFKAILKSRIKTMLNNRMQAAPAGARKGEGIIFADILTPPPVDAADFPNIQEYVYHVGGHSPENENDIQGC